MATPATDGVNTPVKQGLSLDEAFAQLQASRAKASPGEQATDDDALDVVDDDLEDEDIDPEDLDDSDAEDEGDDPEDDAEEDDEDEGKNEEDVPDTWIIDIEGEEVEVTTEELHKGYLRQNDYTRKRQADAKKAKELETDYQGKLELLEKAIAQNVSAEEQQFQRLQVQYQQAPDENTKRNIHYQLLQLQQTIQQRKQAQSAAQQLAQESARAAQEAYWAEQEDMLRAQYENWDTKKEELKGYLESQGFEDLSPFVHHKMAELVDKAKQFDELQQKRKKVVSKKIRRKVPAVLKPGQGEKKFSLDKAAIAKAEAKFKRTGNLMDAQALLRLKRGIK